MGKVKSQRAEHILEKPQFIKSDRSTEMRKYPGSIPLWAVVEFDGDIVKKLSFFGELEDFQKVLLESMATLMIGRPISKIGSLSIRECEAFLRDRNSELAITEMTEIEENNLQKVLSWLSSFPRQSAGQEYVFPSEKGSFKSLKLAERVRELKAFLNSSEILTLYENVPRPELVDVEDLTVYISAPYESQREKVLFEKLHERGVFVFREESLNFIPEY